MSEKLNSEIAVIGIDIGKNSFHLIGQDRRGSIVLRQKWSRGQVEARLANVRPCLIGMEACVGAHHLSRKLQALDERAAVHSITSSARTMMVGGTSSPSALAVLRLSTNSNLTGACTGRSAGLAPLRMRST
jgi:hypothetical protein